MKSELIIPMSLDATQNQNEQEASHSALVLEAYDNLVHELETNGNTQKLAILRKFYFNRFMKYWKTSIESYSKSVNQGINMFNGKEIIKDNYIISGFTNGGRITNPTDTLGVSLNEKSDHDQSYFFFRIGTKGIDTNRTFPGITYEKNVENNLGFIYRIDLGPGLVNEISKVTNVWDPSGKSGHVLDHRVIEFQSLNNNLLSDDLTESD